MFKSQSGTALALCNMSKSDKVTFSAPLPDRKTAETERYGQRMAFHTYKEPPGLKCVFKKKIKIGTVLKFLTLFKKEKKMQMQRIFKKKKKKFFYLDT